MDLPEESMADTTRGMAALHAVKSLPQIGINSLYELVRQTKLAAIIQFDKQMYKMIYLGHSGSSNSSGMKSASVKSTPVS